MSGHTPDYIDEVYHIYRLFATRFVTKSVLCRETPGTGRSEGWRAKAKKERDRLRKRKERMRKDHPHGGGAPDKCCKGVGNRGKIRGVKSKRLQRKDAMRNYTIKKAPGATLQYYHREIEKCIMS